MTDPPNGNGHSQHWRPRPARDRAEPAAEQRHAAALAELVSAALGSVEVDELLGQVARLAARGMPQRDTECDITLDTPHGPHTVAASGELGMQVDEVQYRLGSGPCLDALRSGMSNYVRDHARETRWDGGLQHLVAYGTRTSLSIPLQAGTGPCGSLNLYSGAVDAFPPAARQLAALIAHQASAALTLLTGEIRNTYLSDELQTALASRTVIDQATGILMAQQHCGARTAFDLLGHAAQSRNGNLRGVAADIVRGVCPQNRHLGPFRQPPG